ncbi:MAG TPA: c-type cytochrome [Bryobacteraceae bacterium]|jgi:mono/diheme cytochrome c family protein
MVRGWKYIWALLALAALSLAQEDAPRPGGRGLNTREFLGLGAAPDAAAAARGEKIYKPNCSFCHGEKARGGEGPNLVRSAVVLHDEKGAAISAFLAKGDPEKGMPAFPNFTKEQSYDVAEYLHLQVELVANRGLYKRLNIVTGDAKAGEASFAAQCQQCHSATGDLAHIGTKFPPDQLQNRFVWPGSRTGAKRHATITLASGQTIEGTLKRIDDADVSIYDSAGNYHSWPTSTVKVHIGDPLLGHRKLLEHYTDADIHNLTAYLVTLK